MSPMSRQRLSGSSYPQPRLIAVSVFKARASQILREVDEGHATVLVTNHGRVIAAVVPISRVSDALLDDAPALARAMLAHDAIPTTQRDRRLRQ